MTDMLKDLAEVVRLIQSADSKSWPDDQADWEDFNSAAANFIRTHAAEIEADKRDAERQADALQRIKQWSEAYPLSVFPEPDFARAAEVLSAAGMTLDAISASNMRHVITRVQAIADAAMRSAKEDRNG